MMMSLIKRNFMAERVDEFERRGKCFFAALARLFAAGSCQRGQGWDKSGLWR
jgi:hypothetical protein